MTKFKLIGLLLLIVLILMPYNESQGKNSSQKLAQRCYGKEITVPKGEDEERRFLEFKKEVKKWIRTCVTSGREEKLVNNNQSLEEVWDLISGLKGEKVWILANHDFKDFGGGKFGVKKITFSLDIQQYIEIEAEDVEGEPAEVEPVEGEPAEGEPLDYLEERWIERKDDIVEGEKILKQILKKPHKVAKEIAKLEKNLIEEPGVEDLITVKIKDLYEYVVGSWLESVINGQAKEVSKVRNSLYGKYAMGVASILDPEYHFTIPESTNPEDELGRHFFEMGKRSAKSLTLLQQYQLAIALVRYYIAVPPPEVIAGLSYGYGDSWQDSQLNNQTIFKSKCGFSVFIKGMAVVYGKTDYSVE